MLRALYLFTLFFVILSASSVWADDSLAFCRSLVRSTIPSSSLRLLSRAGGQKVAFHDPKNPRSVYLIVRPAMLGQGASRDLSLENQFQFLMAPHVSAVSSLQRLDILGVRGANIRGFHLIDRDQNIAGGFKWGQKWPAEILALEMERVDYTFYEIILMMNRKRRTSAENSLLTILAREAPRLAKMWGATLEHLEKNKSAPDDLHSGNVGISFSEAGIVEIVIFDPIYTGWHPSFQDVRAIDPLLNASEFRRFHLGLEVFDRLQVPVTLPESVR